MNTAAALTALTNSTHWFKSSHSGGENGCVEVNLSVPGNVGLRDSKLGAASPILLLTTTQWHNLLDEVIADHLTNTNGAVTITARDGIWQVHPVDNNSEPLRFTEHEWTYFRRGARDGEFTAPGRYTTAAATAG